MPVAASNVGPSVALFGPTVALERVVAWLDPWFAALLLVDELSSLQALGVSAFRTTYLAHDLAWRVVVPRRACSDDP